MMKKNFFGFIFALSLAVMMVGQGPATAQWDDQPDGSQVTPDPWPKILKQYSATYTLYQPQLNSWDGYNFAAHAAASVLPSGAKDPSFGVIEIKSKTINQYAEVLYDHISIKAHANSDQHGLGSHDRHLSVLFPRFDVGSDWDHPAATRAAAENNRTVKAGGRAVVDCLERTRRHSPRPETDVDWSGADLHRFR